ncbi:MAG: LysR family transcriptional regulator [Alphaproteobacteria bacterium]|nr:LysR family transcriptional regulator [Alphaproteobacteria bacterium]
MALDWLNYHHLHYFWVTAREGSLTRAAKRLRLSPSTVSSQIKSLEDSLEVELFERRGRRLVLTPTGRMVADYADEIFGLGRELSDAVRHRTGGDRPVRLRVGAVSILHKLVVYRLVAPALALRDVDVHLVCIEDRAEALVAELALHHLDLVLTDTPVGLAREVQAETRVLGSSGLSVFGTPALAERFADGFPGSLDGAPMLFPTAGSTVRAQLEDWIERTGIAPDVVAEFSDSALMKAFGHAGTGLFVLPSLVSADVVDTYGVRCLGALDGLAERYYAHTMERRIQNPAIAAIVRAAEAQLDH